MPQYEELCLSADERVGTVNEDIRLIQKKDGLTFGTDAYLLAAFVRPEKGALCVDLGSGTGIIPLLLGKRNKVARSIGIEVQQDFAALIERNAAINDMSDRLVPLCMDVRKVSQQALSAAERAEQGVCADVVVSNPPYMRVGNGRPNEAQAKYIARHEVCGDIADFCSAAARILKYGGRFYVVYRPDRLTELMQALQRVKLEPKRMTFVHADAESEPSMVLIEARSGGNPSLTITPPLMLHEVESRGLPHRPLTKAAQAIYDRMSFDV